MTYAPTRTRNCCVAPFIGIAREEQKKGGGKEFSTRNTRGGEYNDSKRGRSKETTTRANRRAVIYIRKIAKRAIVLDCLLMKLILKKKICYLYLCQFFGNAPMLKLEIFF